MFSVELSLHPLMKFHQNVFLDYKYSTIVTKGGARQIRNMESHRRNDRQNDVTDDIKPVE